MAKCKNCGSSGWLLSVDNNGLCLQCQQTHLPVIVNHCRIVAESGKIISRTKNPATKLSRVEVAIRSLTELIPYDKKGIPTMDSKPSHLVAVFEDIRQAVISEEIEKNNTDTKVGGDIMRYGLEDWWLLELTSAEREKLASIYTPMGSTSRPLVDGATKRQPELPVAPFLAALAVWANKPETGELALKVADKAKREVKKGVTHTQCHFYMYSDLCKVYYRWRNEFPGSLENAIWACEQNIALSGKISPNIGGGITLSHYCYKQLAIIEEKRGNLQCAIAISKQSQKQGWRGDWNNRISRMEKNWTSRDLGVLRAVSMLASRVALILAVQKS